MTGDKTELHERFRDVVTSEEALRAVAGSPTRHVLDKVLPAIDEMSRSFIAASPFVLIATVGENGFPDVSPKGDPAGFVQVLDEKTLAIPDRPGNRRLDTLTNVLKNPRVGLIFLIPGVSHTLRVSGTAAIVRDETLRQSMAVKGRLPDHALVVSVEYVLSHCAKCMTRSGMWQPDTWGEADAVPTLAEMLVSHAKLSQSVDEMQEGIDADARERLY